MVASSYNRCYNGKKIVTYSACVFVAFGTQHAMRMRHIFFLYPASLYNIFPHYLLTPWSRVLLEKLTGFAASQEIPRIYGTRKFITVLTNIFPHYLNKVKIFFKKVTEHKMLEAIFSTIGLKHFTF
jgi:hypothetical protein